MVSIFGKKKKDDDNQDSGSDNERSGSVRASSTHSSGPPARRSEDPNERTRLLRDHQVPGYLDPDDPAVSPYNLWSVRALRWFEVLFLVITCIWWLLLFISIFVSPPGMHSRGSGFTDISFTTLTVGNIMVALMFFAVPSSAMGILSMSISVLLLIDMIIILAVAKIRAEEGWVGIASVIWAALIGFYNVIANRTVKWGKREEEERLVGRRVSRRSAKEWIAVIVATVIMVLYVLIVILLTATLCLRAKDAGLQAAGSFYSVDEDKYQVHLNCVGNVTHGKNGKVNPTVMIEAGDMPAEYNFEPWIASAFNNGTIGRYCYWDRPGIAWSDNAPSPHSAGMSADALNEALVTAGEHGPYLLVSAGIGSIYSRIFAGRNVRNVAGIILIDGVQEDYLGEIANPGRGFVLWGRGIISPLGIIRLGGALFKGRTSEDRVYGRVSYQNGKYIKAKLQENLIAASLTRAEMSTARNIQDPGVPLVVVSSGAHMEQDKVWKDRQEKLTQITDNLIAWEVVAGKPPNDAPYEEIWQIPEGRELLTKYLGKLYNGTTHGT